MLAAHILIRKEVGGGGGEKEKRDKKIKEWGSN
jgi:hypothetical protein